MPRKVKRDHALDRDWKTQAAAALSEAARLPEGPAKEALLKKARQLETASHVHEWLTSPGLSPPSQ